jgi:intracellular proteinase inhibitor BsuPI
MNRSRAGASFFFMNRSSSFAAVAVLAVALVGCNDGPRQVAGPGLGDASAIVTTIQVNPTEITPGNVFRIGVSSRNPTSGPVTLHFSSGCLQGFTVRDEKGNVVAPLAIVCTANVPVVTLQPDESIDNQFRWGGTTGYGGGTNLPPGDYTITGHLNAAESQAASAPVKVTILP